MELIEICKNAAAAKSDMIVLTTEKKNDILRKAADNLVKKSDYIIAENKIDYENGVSKNMSAGLLDRLKLTGERIEGIAEGLRQVADLEDPVGEVLESFDRPNGMHIDKVRVPLGVIGIIYESRPNVTADAFALTFKTGNVVILKGGSDAIHSNTAITNVIRDTLSSEGINPNVISLIENTDRGVTKQFMKMKEYVDVLIPRGTAKLIQTVCAESNIPVIETGAGNCHIYIDKDADPEKVIPIVINAKTQRIGVCNACESLVIHKDVSDDLLKKLAFALKEKDVEIRGDENAALIMDCDKATDEDFYKEYLDLIISVKTVGSVEEAIDHINKHSTKHSECIITENKEAAEKFLKLVDSACVYHNVSTRFTDGFEFGLGAEIGISTQMLHARGPMGLKEMTTYKYQIKGNGQIR